MWWLFRTVGWIEEGDCLVVGRQLAHVNAVVGGGTAAADSFAAASAPPDQRPDHVGNGGTAVEDKDQDS